LSVATTCPAPAQTGTRRPFSSTGPNYVGGNSKVYGAALFRLRERDFGEVIHHHGVSPAWPLGYSDFEAFYTEAETLFAVHGHRGEDPLEPPASGPYPYPPVSHEPRIAALSESLRADGLHPVPFAARYPP
jgi:choline dehydrogenase-like flavoprotein